MLLTIRKAAGLGRRCVSAYHVARMVQTLGEIPGRVPEAQRKTRASMLLDNFAWWIRHGEVNRLYLAYGLDAKGARNDAVMSNAELMGLIAQQIRRDRANGAVGILKDKHIFSCVGNALGLPTPKTIALLDPEVVEIVSTQHTGSYEAITKELDGSDGFCKPISGRQGRDAFALRIRKGSIFANGVAIGVSELRSLIKERSLLQERVVQHETLTELYSGSVNTVRLVTVRSGSSVRPLAAVLRIGVSGTVTDNWSTGGMVVHVDLALGRLKGYGVFKSGRALLRHPETGAAFDGLELPDFSLGVEYACRFHQHLRNPYSIGWDIAFTPAGPCLIEGNTYWNANVHFAVDPDFKHRYLHAIDSEYNRRK